jgi:hypothetical protein
MQWILDVVNHNDFSMIQNGDVLYILELASGAGEMEGVHFVGTGSDGFVLLGAGIKSPKFLRALAKLKSPATRAMARLKSLIMSLVRH